MPGLPAGASRAWRAAPSTAAGAGTVAVRAGAECADLPATVVDDDTGEADACRIRLRPRQDLNSSSRLTEPLARWVRCVASSMPLGAR